MIDWLRRGMEGAANGMMGMLDAMVPAPPGELATACASIQAVKGYASWMSAWIPWEVIAISIAIVVTGILAAIAIRISRIGVSVLTGGGGA